ncbi:1-acyl-sn-glycerol-3-phosphate acyltransferase [Desulfurella amilsii]|uniref:1-acyl-sn-glycerol-3-phosphate acyltransferase n=1 Tax=Desulfurella amilsii TaxID=1562698 RepID=A0A1X4XYD9_9BACT|nr:lysophospholipid acyltransferase family protein [Desulfurella amilsii]OSS42562.1 1-acyl-sn-glycerol-3-phosphate acyltransferase [Desulfurella amilsii]
MFSFLKWIKIVFYLFFYYFTQKNTKIAIKKLSEKTIKICKTRIIFNKTNINSKNFVIMATHKSYFDIFCIEHCFGDAKIIWFAKQELFKIPFYGHMLKETGALSVDRKSVIKSALAIRKLLKEKKDNVAFAIFPYGTRKHTNDFKSGGIYFAKKLKLPIIPVRIDGSCNVMPPGKITIKENQTVNVKVFEAINYNEDFDKIESILKNII